MEEKLAVSVPCLHLERIGNALSLVRREAADKLLDRMVAGRRYIIEANKPEFKFEAVYQEYTLRDVTVLTPDEWMDLQGTIAEMKFCHFCGGFTVWDIACSVCGRE